MTGSKRYSPTATLVSKAAISQASSTLMDLPEKPQEIWSLREAINTLQDQIILALDRGYGYPEIAEMLTQQGIEISSSTLKYYLSSVRRTENSKRRRTARKVSKHTLTSATTVVADAASDLEEKKTPVRKVKAEPKVATSKAVKATKTATKLAKIPKDIEEDTPQTDADAKNTPKTATTRGRRKATTA